MNCGQCVHFAPHPASKTWGSCCAPYPSWIDLLESASNLVRPIEGSIGNYANDCDLFTEEVSS